MAAQSDQQPAGPAADAQGRSVVDPSENVKALNQASIDALNDLRKQDNKHARTQRKLIAHYENQMRKGERRGIRRQLKVIEANRVEQKTDTKVAVDAALSAAKEAVGKNEIFVKEQLAQQSSTAGQQSQAQSDKLDELKIRFERFEQYGAGGHARSQNIGWWIFGGIAAMGVLGGLFLTFISIVLGIVYFLSQR